MKTQTDPGGGAVTHYGTRHSQSRLLPLSADIEYLLKKSLNVSLHYAVARDAPGKEYTHPYYTSGRNKF